MSSLLRRVLVLADESADWKVAGLRQLDRLLLCLEEFAAGEGQLLEVGIRWSEATTPNEQWIPENGKFTSLRLNAEPADSSEDESADLVLNTHLFLYRQSIAQLRAVLPNETRRESAPLWQHLASRREIPACERRFLARSGKSQDGLVSRHLNRPLSRALSRWLLKFPITPTGWSLAIFILPLLACVFFVRGTAAGFIIGCAIFQLYSILDGCDGEIARAKFLQSESGRRLDSLCDLLGNVLLALSLGGGLARQALATESSLWLFYLIEGVAAALLILLSEGIVFIRRARPETELLTKWNGALYQRHHELIERSGLLLLGEKFAWWIVQLTKRDMAMLGFLVLAALGWPEWILHLQLLVAGVSSALAGNAFLRPAPVVVPEKAG